MKKVTVSIQGDSLRITSKNKDDLQTVINLIKKQEDDLDKKLEQLKNENKWKEIEFFKSDYIASKDVNAWLGVYEVIK